MYSPDRQPSRDPRRPHQRRPHASPVRAADAPAARARRCPAARAAVSLAVLALLLLVGGAPRLAHAADPTPGRQPDGSTTLIDQRTITPAGQQTNLGKLPLGAVFSPDGKYLLVANSGGGTESLQVVATADSHVVQTIPFPSPQSVYIGVAYSPDGTRAYAAGGYNNVVRAYTVGADGALTPAGTVPLATAAQKNPYPAGLSVSPDGRSLYVANDLANTVSVVDTGALTVTKTIRVGGRPYTTLVSPDGKGVYVSNWGDDTLSVISTTSATVAATITVGVPNVVTPLANSHPTAMAFGPAGTPAAGLLFVSLSNSDAIAVIDTATGARLRTIDLRPYAGAPLSSSPQGLSVSPDGARLYVALAGEDAVAMIGLNGARGPETVMGRIPVAWYPSDVRASADGRLFVLNAKGLGAGPNDTGHYPNPTSPIPRDEDQYTGSMIVGTLSMIPVPDAAQLQAYSAQVATNNKEGDTAIDQRDAGNPIPLPGGASPLKHVIYIIKENRTYDQVFGDESIGNNRADLTLFGRRVTPNIHALAERFGLLDNFYANGEVSADGHNWTDSANASDYNEKSWVEDYSGRQLGYGGNISLSPGGYLWDMAAKAGISYRYYGEFSGGSGSSSVLPAARADTCAGPVTAHYSGQLVPAGDVLCLPAVVGGFPNLAGHVAPHYQPFDLNYPEADRVAAWRSEFAGFVRDNNLPNLEVLWVPNDHTSGLQPGQLTPQSYVATNDQAVGAIADSVSHSPYWKDTAIFVTEDDAQDGPDHVDAHRTESLVISPYTAQAAPRVDHALYDTASMVRTIELILGLQPMSQFDANATPMWRAFTGTPDTTPYDLQAAQAPLTATNPGPAITSIDVAGTVTDPTFTIDGTGFGAAPAAQVVNPAGVPDNGADFGDQLFIYTPTFSMGFNTATSLNGVGLVVLRYTDTQIVVKPGAAYTRYKTPAPGDIFHVRVKGLDASTVFPALGTPLPGGPGGGGAATPELGSDALLGGGILALGLVLWRRRRRGARDDAAVGATLLGALLLVAAVPAYGHLVRPSFPPVHAVSGVAAAPVASRAASAPTTPRVQALRAAWEQASAGMFSGPLGHIPDTQNPRLLNRAIWYSVKGYTTPYPGDKTVLMPQEVLDGDHYLWQLRPDLGSGHGARRSADTTSRRSVGRTPPTASNSEGNTTGPRSSVFRTTFVGAPAPLGAYAEGASHAQPG